MFKQILNIIPWVGMALLQFNAVPAIITALEEGSSTPLGTIFLTLGGLSCYMVRAVVDRDMLYMVGNTIGLIGNIILLICVI